MLNFRRPLLAEISDDTSVMDQVMERLEFLGFMDAAGSLSICPYRALLDGYFDANHTMPTHLLLTDAPFDDQVDGPSVRLCGQAEIDEAAERLSGVEELDWERFMDRLSEWLTWH